MDRSLFGERKVNVRFPRMQSNHVTYVPLAVHLLRSHKVRNKYQQSFEQHLSQFQCDAEGSVEDQWGILRDCIMTSAEEIIRRARKKQPDWFIDATDILAPLLDNKARAHQK